MAVSTRPRRRADEDEAPPSRESVLQFLAAAREAEAGRPEREFAFPRGRDGMKRRRRDRD